MVRPPVSSCCPDAVTRGPGTARGAGEASSSLQKGTLLSQLPWDPADPCPTAEREAERGNDNKLLQEMCEL